MNDIQRQIFLKLVDKNPKVRQAMEDTLIENPFLVLELIRVLIKEIKL